MKSNKEAIDKKIADTLSSLNHVKRARVKPFFYTRLKARMQQGEKGFWSLFLNPQLIMAVASVFLLLCLNFYVVINYESGYSTQSDGFSAFMNDYRIDSGSIYQLNE